MARVFLIEEPRANLDVSSAAAFGDLIYLFGPMDRRHSVFNPNAYASDVLAQLAHLQFDYQNDLICVTGSMVPIVLAVLTLAVSYPWLNILFYNASEGQYVARVVDPAEWKGYSDDQAQCLSRRKDAGCVQSHVHATARDEKESRDAAKGNASRSGDNGSGTSKPRRRHPKGS